MLLACGGCLQISSVLVGLLQRFIDQWCVDGPVAMFIDQ